MLNDRLEVRIIQTNFFLLRLVTSKKGIRQIDFIEEQQTIEPFLEQSAMMKRATQTINAYFKGVPIGCVAIDMIGLTNFEHKVLATAQQVGFGQTTTYAQLAKMAGLKATYARAVANALHKNPLPIVIGCHRILREDGKDSGYRGGLWRKKLLLEHEKAIL